MQQVHGNKHFYPEYVDRLILFFTSSGGIIMRMGNRYVVAGAAEVREIVDARLVRHARFAELFNRGDNHEQS